MGWKRFFRRKQWDEERARELEAYLQIETDENLARGMSPEDARYAAHRKLGNLTLIREEIYTMNSLVWLETLWQDFRYAARMLRKSPGFALVAVLTLALGIGANAAMFSVMNAMLLRALPVRNPQQLVEFVRLARDGAMMTNLPYPVFEYLRKDSTVLSGIFAFTSDTRVLRDRAGADRFFFQEVSGSFFQILGVKALLGRTIDPNDDRRDADHQVAVLSYPFWSRHFGGDPSAIGSAVHLDGKPCIIIGVMPPDFFGVDPSQVPEMWVPLASDPGASEVWVLGRLRPEESIRGARARLEPLFKQAVESLLPTMEDSPAHERDDFLAQKLLLNRATQGTSGLRWEFWEYSNTLKILLGMTALVLLIATVNLANLLMARAAARSQEFGVRLAIGAGRRRLLRQLLTENLLLSVLGGGAGLLLAVWGHRLLLTFLLGGMEGRALDFQLDARLLGFCAGFAIVVGLFSGMLPAWRAARGNLYSLRGGALSIRGPARLPLARKLLVVQLALSLVLLMGAGLFAHSLRNLASADPGVERENLVLMSVHPYLSKLAAKNKQAFWTQLTARLAAVPGVRSLSLAGDGVFGVGWWNTTIWLRQPDGSV